MNLWDKIKNLLAGEETPEEEPQRVPVKDYDSNLAYLHRVFGGSADFLVREFRIGGNGRRAAVLLIEHLADKTKVAEQIIWPLTSTPSISTDRGYKTNPDLARELLIPGEITEQDDLRKAEQSILQGHTVLLIDGLNKALAINLRAKVGRDVTTAEIESSLLGPKAAFSESIQANLAMIRHRLRSPNFRVETFMIGTKSIAHVQLLFVEGVVPPGVLSAARSRLQQLQVDEVNDISQLGELMEVSPLSPFPQGLFTERPDKVSAYLLEGRVAFLFDGDSEALILPVAFSDLFQSPEDYNVRSLAALLLRTIRVVGFVVATILPGLYVALVSFNYEVLPSGLALSVAEARAGIPFPPVVEGMVMFVLVDILQEGTTRLPSKIGQTVGVVGGLVLSQAVIQARIVSPLMIIVVATSVIGSYAVPNYRVLELTRIIRYTTLIAAGTLSGIGVAFVWILLLAHMCSLEILGLPYLRPLAPLRLKSFSDFLFRRPARFKSTTVSRRVEHEDGNQ